MSPEARRRSISEKAIISIPVGIVALLLLIVIPLCLVLYYRRSRRSRLVSKKPVDLVGDMTTSVSMTSVVSQMDCNKELPQTPPNAQFIIDIRADPYTPSHDDNFSRSRSTRERQTMRPRTLPSSRSIENLANDRLQRASSLDMSTYNASGPVPSSSRNGLRVLNLTDEDTSFMNQLSTPRSPSSLKTLVEKQDQICAKYYSGDLRPEKSSKLAGSPRKAGAERSRNTYHAPFVKKNFKEHTRLSTPASLPFRKATGLTGNDRNDTKVAQDRTPKLGLQSQLQTSKLAINIPMYPIYHDSSLRSAFYDMMPEKGPETALPPYSSPGNGHPFRLSMFT